MLKFLKTEEIEIEEGLVKLVMNPITTTVQGRLLELAQLGTVSETVQRTQYALKNIIQKLEIEGKEYPPYILADTVDLNDIPTRDIFIQIAKMVMSNAFVEDETVKK